MAVPDAADITRDKFATGQNDAGSPRGNSPGHPLHDGSKTNVGHGLGRNGAAAGPELDKRIVHRNNGINFNRATHQANLGNKSIVQRSALPHMIDSARSQDTLPDAYRSNANQHLLRHYHVSFAHQGPATPVA